MKMIFNSNSPKSMVEERKRALRNLADFTYQCIKKPKNMQPEKVLFFLNELKSAVFKMREFSYDNYADCEVIHDLMGELAHNWTYGQVINKIINILPDNVPVKHQLQRDLVSIQKRYGLVYYKDFNQTWRPPSERKNDFIEINSFYYMVFKSFTR